MIAAGALAGRVGGAGADDDDEEDEEEDDAGEEEVEEADPTVGKDRVVAEADPVALGAIASPVATPPDCRAATESITIRATDGASRFLRTRLPPPPAIPSGPKSPIAPGSPAKKAPDAEKSPSAAASPRLARFTPGGSMFGYMPGGMAANGGGIEPGNGVNM
jgi:hypothetical protein